MEDDSFILTHTRYRSPTAAVAYNENGWLKNLPDLMVTRSKHGCTSFISGGTRV